MRELILSIKTALVLPLALSSNAYSQAPQPRVVTIEMPRRYRCLDVLELEKLRFESTNGQTGYFNSLDMQLAFDYSEISGWIEGFMTARNLFDSLILTEISRTARLERTG
jgi:hypothetical protein